MNYRKLAEDYFSTFISTLQKIDIDELVKVVRAIEFAVSEGRTIYVMGNGGSSSTASHMHSDLGNTVSQLKGKKINVSCLSDNIATITAIANDYSYDLIYVRQLEGRLKEGDLVIAISGSGNSKNIIKAVEYAKSVRAQIVAMTGYDGGEVKKIADLNLNVFIDNMQIAEDIHLLFNHLIVHILNLSDQDCRRDY
ncbi:SIS domain-containing protein [Pseudomonas sp. 148P]|uniref:SIS domain-containing protein n=1 Tax=Pseudomonas ulcerans TaxID=3115852 RepID=A0ABU7HJI2_9PSED|nr:MULTISPECIES: SIS domain-containing protein [unclassified Pseudomonas]MEE1921388.1 SIS domain-containing protein [Pseudomonas sp. 147P]MEE1931671.1 SIS domain-containing protein [Pseudomonas sp. 148P]